MSTLETVIYTSKKSLVPARDLKPGTVYTYGVRAVHYMRISGGAVVVTSGAMIGNVVTHSEHLNTLVEVCDATLTITNP